MKISFHSYANNFNIFNLKVCAKARFRKDVQSNSKIAYGHQTLIQSDLEKKDKIPRQKMIIIPVVMGALGTIKKDMENCTNKIPGSIDINEIQKITLLSTAHLLRRVLSIK